MKIAVAGGTGTVGRHVSDAVVESGHELILLARSAGIDLVDGTGLAAAIAGAEVVIDVSGISSISGRASRRFFSAATTHLLAAEAQAGVRHHVALSVVNAAGVNAGYYAGKALQERLIEHGSVPWTILRATQFHEFAQQTFRQGSLGPLAVVPMMRTRPVAAREVADNLVRLALGPAKANVPDLGGPREESLVDMARSYAQVVHARGPVIGIPLPGRMGKAMRAGGLLPSPGASRGIQTFAEWLQTQDVSRSPGRRA